MSYTFLFDAKDLQKSESKKEQIANYTAQILQTIQDEVATKNRRNEKQLTIRLPSSFSIIGISNVEAQTHIYSAVIEVLIQKHFNVEIDSYSDKTPKLTINWAVPNEQIELENKTKFIAKFEKRK